MDPGLDFASLLGIAEHVSKGKATTGVQLMKTKFSGPKKEKREKGKLNENVKRFLEKQEEDKRAKERELKEQRKQLHEMRSDRAKNKIAKHLKVTKSANKAVLSDAINTKDTSVTLNGRKQCDEDDYGFESNVSNSVYEKLMGKYESCPEDPMSKFSKAKPKTHVDISSAKERVKMALRQETEDPLVRKRKRKHDGVPDEAGVSYTREAKEGRREERAESERKEEKGKRERDREKEEAAAKRRENAKKAPKPMDFQALLQIANTVKDQPIVLKPKKDIKESDFGTRPMTKKQKDEWMRENSARLRREGKLPPKESTPPSSQSLKKSSDRKEDRQKSEEKSMQKVPKVRKPEPGPELHAAVKKSLPPPPVRKPAELPRKSSDLGRKDDRKSVAPSSSRKPDDTAAIQREYRELQEKCKAMEEKMKMQEENRKLQEKIKAMEAKLSKSSSSSSGSGGSSSQKSKSSDSRKRDIRDVPARQFPGEKRKPKEKDRPRRNRIESDSEYDSEMDDFIDDGDADVDISKEIRSIFGYDRHKYRDEPDFDDRSMENNRYSSIMQEEIRSARIGRMEDLEDMRREEAEKKRKLKKR